MNGQQRTLRLADTMFVACEHGHTPVQSTPPPAEYELRVQRSLPLWKMAGYRPEPAGSMQRAGENSSAGTSSLAGVEARVWNNVESQPKPTPREDRE